MAADMLDYLLSNKLLNSNQHSFLSKRCTLTNLLESISDWAISLENRFANRVEYIDFSRAFGAVSHPKLLYKLKSYGIEGVLHQRIGNFLTERSHCTRVNNVYSSFDYIRTGVVQGSCLGPLLFLIYINDIIDCFDDKVNCNLYADDAKLYTELRSGDSYCFQECIDSIYISDLLHGSYKYLVRSVVLLMLASLLLLTTDTFVVSAMNV